ncbi:unnamed protein product [Vitrella brassicaformis CCMP3155]|uniref:tRNA 4-demethylwyosine synthase (AdoMet-dependent) n=1 Tax=Vitrella brassicaformis (strain CCMP3155) TaxID=1169540 RepID=A0A0G4FMM3_VITBC|nr:unnamed protein product [Vitrella brassicaformis CCMP3155]|eukprot:CEM14822.1 unnamed protein product [Vitrella brassicaformis CCMP3155]
MWSSLGRPDLRRGSSRGERVLVLFASLGGTAKAEARQLVSQLRLYLLSRAHVAVSSMSDYNIDDLTSERCVIVVISTYTDGLPPPAGTSFFAMLEDWRNDFRVDKAALAQLRYAIVGLGSHEYGEQFCRAAHTLDRLLHSLSAHRILPTCTLTDTADIPPQLTPWLTRLFPLVHAAMTGSPDPPEIHAAAAAAAEADHESDVESDGSASDDGQEGGGEAEADDVEDIVGGKPSGEGSSARETAREMVTSRQRAALTKEGYRIVGSHSAVKLCRWTKHQLRGRGGCYKHSFYGIESYACMEATPSLACANKCVFCWRHHKNPVGKEWRWALDPPEMIVQQTIDNHRQLVKTLKGMPGVIPERLEAAMKIRHCALSLVGEPIMYPHINELIAMLHERHISTFLVTNAQFPEAIRNLKPVTQLYVSVDAATPETLKAVDRPLFGDYWDRFVDSLTALRERRQRTVYRLTLVKQHNMQDACEYGRLVSLGRPDFIEIKSVTYCGTSTASHLTIKHVPYHQEVLNFADAIISSSAELADEYELACEHEHSNCVVIAKKSFKIDGVWHTWIDYDRFHQLATSGELFGALDYCAPTPQWAVRGAQEKGFDPIETRHYPKGKARRLRQTQDSQ